jgi:DNA-binding protein H-NS
MARLSYDNIKKQIARLEAQAKALETARDDSKARAVERVRALMKKLGVEIADLEAAPASKGRRGPRVGGGGTAVAGKKAPAAQGGKKPGAPRAPVPAKYRDPESGATWSGRGRTPVWLAAYLEQGKSRESFEIQPPPAPPR